MSFLFQRAGIVHFNTLHLLLTHIKGSLREIERKRVCSALWNDHVFMAYIYHQGRIGKCVGVGFGKPPSISKPGFACVQNIMVHRDFRRQGIGRSLFNRLVTSMDAHPCFVELHPNQYPLIPVLSENGFYYVGPSQDHYNLFNNRSLFRRFKQCK